MWPHWGSNYKPSGSLQMPLLSYPLGHSTLIKLCNDMLKICNYTLRLLTILWHFLTVHLMCWFIYLSYRCQISTGLCYDTRLLNWKRSQGTGWSLETKKWTKIWYVYAVFVNIYVYTWVQLCMYVKFLFENINLYIFVRTWKPQN